MARTGYLVTVYQDINPSSPTYNQTKEEREYNTTECPLGKAAEWVETSRYCEMLETGAQTGYEIIVYTDVEPTSSTYGNTREEKVLNTTDCESDNSEPEWVNIGDPYCRQKVYLPGGEMGNDGYWIQQQQDMNEYSPTADQIKDIETLDLEHCTVPDTTPVYTIISETCHTVSSGSGVAFDGTKDVVRIDTNKYSETYNFNIPESVNIPDEENCPKSDNAPEWSEESYVCELDASSAQTGYANITYKDINPLSETYGETKTEKVKDEERCIPGEIRSGKVNVTFNVRQNSGKWSDNNTTDYVKEADKRSTISCDKIAISTQPLIYGFAGWNENSMATSGNSSVSVGTSDTTVYAIFKVKDCEVVIKDVSTGSDNITLEIETLSGAGGTHWEYTGFTGECHQNMSGGSGILECNGITDSSIIRLYIADDIFYKLNGNNYFADLYKNRSWHIDEYNEKLQEYNICYSKDE